MHRTFGNLVLLLLAHATCSSWPGGTACALVVESGDFATKVESLRDLTFTSGSGLYVAPTMADRGNFSALASTLYAGNLAAADVQAAALNYDLIRYSDNVSNDVYYGLTEQLVGGVPTRGWGSYFLRFNPAANVLLEVPHPRFDTNSWEIAANAFRQSDALGFLMAGAHRNANGSGTADVAHLTASIFHETHAAWNGVAGENIAWSIHGFDDANHAFPAGTDVVLSNGDGSVSAEVVLLDEQFEEEGLLTFAYNTLPALDPLNVQVNGAEAGSTFSTLGATTNVQGIYSRGLGGRFIHIEMEQSIRFDAMNRDLAASAIATAIFLSSAVPEPSTLLLLAACGAMLLPCRIRRK